jgi:hypothetical protein
MSASPIRRAGGARFVRSDVTSKRATGKNSVRDIGQFTAERTRWTGNEQAANRQSAGDRRVTPRRSRAILSLRTVDPRVTNRQREPCEEAAGGKKRSPVHFVRPERSKFLPYTGGGESVPRDGAGGEKKAQPSSF